MDTDEPLLSRRAVRFSCIFGIVHLVVAVAVFMVSLGLAVSRHVSGGPPTLVANATHAISDVLFSPMLGVFMAVPSRLDYLLPAPLSFFIVFVNSGLWAVSAWVIVWSLRRLVRKGRLLAP